MIPAATGRIIGKIIFLKFIESGRIAKVSPNPHRRTFRVDLLDQGLRFELPANTPIGKFLEAIENGKGGGR